MNPFDLLIVFLSIAVAFAGFAGIVSLIDRRAAHVSPHVVSFRVRSLIQGVLLVMVQSVLPFILVGFDTPLTLTWRLGCAFLALSGFGLFVVAIRERRKLSGELGEGFSALQWNLVVVLGVLATAGSIAAAAGQVPPVGTYLVVVFFYLMGNATLFMRLVQMLDESVRNRAE